MCSKNSVFLMRKNTPARLQKRELDELLHRLKSLEPYVPHDFARRLRGLDELSNWNATEFPFWLMYGGIVIFPDIISQELYEHFL